MKLLLGNWKKTYNVAIASIVLSSSALATEINMATSYPDSNFQTKLVKNFAERVNHNTNGNIKIKVHSNSGLISAGQIVRATRTGQVQLGERIGSSLSNQDPIFAIDSLPFLTSSYKDAWHLYQASKPLLTKRLDKMGLVLLYSVPWPPQGLYTPSKINSIADVSGVRLRTYDQFTNRLVKSMGALPTKINASELSQAFATSMIDGMVGSGGTAHDLDLYRYLPFWYDISAWTPKNLVFINKRYFNSLSEKDRLAISTAAADSEKEGWKVSQQQRDLFIKYFREGGTQVISSLPAVLEKELHDIGDNIITEWEKDNGSEYSQIITQYKTLSAKGM